MIRRPRPHWRRPSLPLPTVEADEFEASLEVMSALAARTERSAAEAAAVFDRWLAERAGRNGR